MFVAIQGGLLKGSAAALIKAERILFSPKPFVRFRIWRYIPSELKESTSLNELKIKNKNIEATKPPPQTL